MTGSNVVPIGQARMPAGMRQRIDAGKTTNSNFAGGIRDTFPILSIKGKVFRLRKDGAEQPLVDPTTRQVIPFLDVILVNAAPTLSKAYYEKGFDEGEMTPPDCWSLDAVRPDPSVVNKVNPVCATCPKNIFGSAMAQDGSARGGKACQDAKRIAVIMPGHLGKENPLIFLLRVPATSLKNLKAYSDLLARQGWEPGACVTRLQFDYQVAYPKLDFHFIDGLDDDEYAEVVQHAESSYVASMLAAPDFDAGHTQPQPNPATQPKQRQEAPILDDTQTVGDPTPRNRPAAQKPDLKVVEEDLLIELPDGKLFNPATGEFVERPEPKVEMPQKDPDVIELPDGRFYNKRTKSYVTGDTNAAQQVADAPPKRTRAPRTKKAAPPVQENTPAAEQQSEPEQEVKPAVNGNGEVKPASADLEAMLKDLVPTRKS